MSTRTQITGTILALTVAGFVSTARGQCGANEFAKLLASDGAWEDQFGGSVAVRGDVALVGACYDNDHGVDSGSAYVFWFDGATWLEEAKLTASDGAAEDYFGQSVAVSADPPRRVLIGAWYDDDHGPGSGSAYVFRCDGSAWVEEAKLTASDGAAEDYFGRPVAISCGSPLRALVGASNHDHCTGSAYVFRLEGTNWVEEAKLVASDGVRHDYFGHAVAISNEPPWRALIGAYWDDDQGDHSGSAYVFRFDGINWVEEAKLTPSDGAPNDQFGESVVISGDTAIVGATGDDDLGDWSGSAYVFRFDGTTWVEEAKLTAFDGAPYDYFGGAVAVSGGPPQRAIIGAHYGDQDGGSSGAAYQFRFDGANWVAEAKLTASDGTIDDHLGISVAISGDTVLLGADGDDESGNESGSVYVFRGVTRDCNANGTLDACDLTDGTSEDCNANAVPDECDLAEGTSVDVNANGIPDECEDCNGNGVADDQDLAEGTSQDCNDNSIPDECDVAEGTSEDLNGNGIPDECETECVRYEDAKLLASDAAANDDFGYAVALSGDTAIVGASGDDDNGGRSGSAYVFRFDGTGWVDEVKLTPSDGAASDYFGESVAMSGDTAIVGASGDDDNGGRSGSAYVFRFDGTAWVEEAKLTPSDGAASDYFGESAAMTGDTAIVGASGDDDHGSYSGSAYVFRFDGTSWIEEAKLTPPDGAPYDDFGESVVISGDTAIVGATGDDDNGIYSGSAYVFRFDGTNWVEEAKLTPSDGAPADQFGKSVVISGGTAIVGATGDDDHGDWSGSAYVFRFDGIAWVEEAKLTASDGAPNDRFGESVVISGNTAIVAARGDDPGHGVHCGSVYVFRFDGTTWAEVGRLTASDYWVGAIQFGGGLGISGDTAIVGAVDGYANGVQSGSSYVFRGVPFDCNENYVLDNCDLTGGTSADCNGNSIPDECDLSEGTSADCNGNNIPDDCEPDADHDGLIDDCDPCPFDELNDPDGDGYCSGSEQCPDDPMKSVPGQCGCGYGPMDDFDVETDTDDDGVSDCVDRCPNVDDHLFPHCETAIPALSTWGLVIMALLLLTGLKLRFRQAPLSDSGSRN